MIVLFYVGLVISIAALVLGIIKTRKLIKNPLENLNYKEELKPIFYIGVAFVVAFTMLSIGLFNFVKDVKPYEYILGILGGAILAASIYLFVTSFMIHYYRKGLPAKLDKWLYIILLTSIPMMMVFFFVFLDGYAAHLIYPLANGINFEHGFVNINSTYSSNIAWYALCILSGAVFVYFLCDHKMYVQYGKHGLLESTFLVAFPAGIIGARIFYVIGNWTLEFQGKEWWKMFAIWEGGLTILGGAIMGIVVGVGWFMWRNKGYNIFVAVDIIVPTILLAQAIGRWGNFFNCEVHGQLVNEAYFAWLPTVIFENIKYSGAAGMAPSGYVYVPLFLIEGIMNVAGYFLIAELFGRKLRKYTELGDLAFGYIIWYGLVRACLEPLRYGDYNMGEDGFWSWIWSVCFIAIGMFLIAANHIVRHIIDVHRGVQSKIRDRLDYIITMVIFLGIAAATLFPGIILMSQSYIPQTLTFNHFMIGLILVIVSIGFVCLSTIPLTYWLYSKKEGSQVA